MMMVVGGRSLIAGEEAHISVVQARETNPRQEDQLFRLSIIQSSLED